MKGKRFKSVEEMCESMGISTHRETCELCGGSGGYWAEYFTIPGDRREDFVHCETCNGKGYRLEFEFPDDTTKKGGQ